MNNQINFYFDTTAWNAKEVIPPPPPSHIIAHVPFLF